jgi:hypothetical protein
MVSFLMANNEKQSAGLWSKTRYEGDEVWAHLTIKSLMDETGFSIEEGEVEDENTLYVHGVDSRNLNTKEYRTALRTLNAYLAEKCKKEAGYNFEVYDDVTDTEDYYEISMYTCPVGKVGVLKYQSVGTTGKEEKYSVYIGNLAWKNVKDATIDIIDEIITYGEVSEETKKEYDRHIEEIEKLPE